MGGDITQLNLTAVGESNFIESIIRYIERGQIILGHYQVLIAYESSQLEHSAVSSGSGKIIKVWQHCTFTITVVSRKWQKVNSDIM